MSRVWGTAGAPRGSGMDGACDGIVIGHLTASFVHLHDTASNHWVARLVEFVRACKRAPADRDTAQQVGILNYSP